jgi:predicted Fe-Mo cluster-binding NifX family protein
MSNRTIIALPVEDDAGLESDVCQHFGHAAGFALVEVDGAQIASCRVVRNPMAEDHQPGMLPGFVHSTGANVLLAGGMGPRAVDLLHGFGIDVATGAQGRVRDVVTAYLAGNLTGITPCDHSHDHGGGCGDHTRHHGGPT